MEEKFRIGDMEYTVQSGPCSSGGNLLCTVTPGSNERKLEQWMQHDQANQALRRVADGAYPVNGALNHTVIRQLDQMACRSQLCISRQKIDPQEEIIVPRVVRQKPCKPWWPWMEKGSDPLGLGFWETHKIDQNRFDKNDRRHKLAFEIAGTRQLSLNGEIAVASENGTMGRYDLSRRGEYAGHRRLVYMENIDPGDYSLHLKIADYRYGRYAIPLTVGERNVPTCPKPTLRDRWETVLVPILPRTYSSIHLDRHPDHCDYPPIDGWIYIFLDGRLWREVQAREHGGFSDVNLAMEKGRDIRAATGKPDRTILTPYQVQGHRPAIEICFAQAQWSWAQVESLGGMAADDTRLKMGPAIKPVKTSPFPAKRLQPVDLSSYPDFDQGPGCVGHARQKGELIPARRKDLRSFFDTGAAVVYLHNALGIAESLSQQYYDKLTELRQVVADLPTLKDVDNLDPAMANAWAGDKEAYYQCAVMAYRVFFDPSTTRDKAHWDNLAQAQGMSPFHAGKTPFDLGGSSRLRRRTGQGKRPKIFDTCQKELHRETLENILQVEKRRTLRANMRQIKKILVSFLQDFVDLNGDDPGRPATAQQPDFIGVNAMLADFANLNGLRYGLLWKKSEGLIGFLNHEPCTEDPDLDISADIATEKPARPERDPGYTYLQCLFKPSHPLCAMLWPTQEQVDHAREEYIIPSDAEPADGGGIFRKGAFHCATEGKDVLDRPADKNLKDLAKINKQITAHILWVFEKQWKNIKDTTSTVTVCTLVRLLKASGHPDLEGLNVVPAGSRIDLNEKSYVVLGAQPARFESLSKAAFMKQRPGSATASNNSTGPVKIHSKGAAGPVVAAPDGDAAHYGDQTAKITRKEWKEIWGKAKAEGERVYTARTPLAVIPAKYRYAISYYNEQIKSASRDGLKTARKTLPPVIAALEMVNFGRAGAVFIERAHKGQLDIKTAIKPVFVAVSFTYYTLDAAVVLGGKQPVAKAFGSIGKLIFIKKVKFMGQRVVIFNAVGVLVTGLSAITSAWDSISSIMRDDDDAAAGYAIAAVALSGLALAKLGLLEVAAFTGLAPWAVPLLIVGIVGTVVTFMLTDSELEKWSKHGPFAGSPKDRWRYDYEHKRPIIAYEGLLGALLKPAVTIDYSETNESRDKCGIMVPDVEVSFLTPGYHPNTSELIVEVTAQRGPHADGTAATIKMAKGEEDYQQHPQRAYRQEPIVDHLSRQTVGTKFSYRGLGLSGQYHWRVRARHITKQYDQSIVLPTLLGKMDDEVGQSIDSEAPGWVYADN